MSKKNTKNKYKKFVDWCCKEIGDLQADLNLCQYNVGIHKTPTVLRENTAMSIDCYYPYLNAEITWTEKTYTDWLTNKITVKKYLLHEIIHLVIEPLTKAGRERWGTERNLNDMDELVTDHFSGVLYDLLNKKK